MCSACQDYWVDIWKSFVDSSAPGLGVGLAVVGCGAPKLGIALAKDFGSLPSDSEKESKQANDQSASSVSAGRRVFSLYSDQSREIYKQLGLKSRVVFKCGLCLEGTWRALKQSFCKCWPCLGSSGDVTQQGGAFVLTQAGQCLLKHIEQEPGDHEQTKVIIQCAVKHRENEMGASSQSS